MAKQNINVGTTANDKKGDSLRAAFQKVNANFTELYTALGINADVDLNLGAFEFTGSVMTTTDSTAIVIDQAATITSNLSVGGDILPQTALGGDLGSSTLPWRSLYVSNNTIFLGGTALSVNGAGNLLVNGSLITGGGGGSSLVNGANTVSLGSDGILTLPNGAVIRNTAGDAVAFGQGAGETSQGEFAVAIGPSAGQTSQGPDAVAIGNGAGLIMQATSAVAIGLIAGNNSQGAAAVAIGYNAGYTGQGFDAVAIGDNAGYSIQGKNSVAIGLGAGQYQQGRDAVAIGHAAGVNNQAANSIILNATGATLNQTTANTFTVKPVRQGETTNAMYYNSSTGEITYAEAFSFNVAADDSTQRLVSNNELIKFTGAGGITTASDAEGNITINYVQGDIRSEGDINIDINLADSTLRRWRFGEDGSLTLPIGVSIDDNVSPLYPKIIADSGKLFSVQGQGSTGSVAIAWSLNPNTDTQYAAVGVNGTGTDNLAKVVLVAGNTTATLKVWKLDETGVFTLPTGGVIADSGNYIKLTPPTGSANQSLLIYPTAGDGNHIHLTAGGGTTELYLGNDIHYVKLVNGGNVEVRANNGVNDAAWTFGTDGALTIPGDIKSNSNINIDINLADSTLRRWQFGEDGDLTFPNGVLKIAGNTISNYVDGDMGGSGSQLEVSQSKTVITNGVTSSLGGGSGITSQALFEVSTNGILSSFQVINTLGGGGGGLTGEYLTELFYNSFKIGQRVTNDLGDGSEPLVAFNGWTFGTVGDSQQQVLTFPDGTVQTTAPESFSFSVAADDSTQRAISNNESIKFIGAGGITTASDAEGNITITGSGAAAGSLTGTALASGVVSSSLTSVGTLGTLNVTGAVTAESFNTDQITVVGNRITTTVTNANLEIECNGTGALTISGSIIGTATQNVFNTISTTVNAFGAATILNIGAAGGTTTIAGDLVVSGTTTTINSTTLTVDDKNIELGSVATPSNTTADGGGITLKGATDKTIVWDNANTNWTASEHWNIASGKKYKINNVDVLTATSVLNDASQTSVTIAGSATTALNIGASGAPITGFAATATTSSTASSLGYLGLPQSATATTATLAIGDAGKHIYITTTGQTITIPANASVAYPIGTTITFIAGPSATTATIAIATDTLRLAGGTSTGTRTLAANGMATAVKVAATTWYINGTGLT